MSLESKVANTGPVPATISPMTVDMVGPAGCFGRLDLPEIKTSSSGTTITVTNQKIKIVNMDAFIAFNKSIMADDSLTLHLENGKATIKVWPMSTKITYSKSVQLKGMSGPKTVMKKTELHDDKKSFKNTMITINPSPLEIDLGTLKQEIWNERGERIAEQKGKTYLMRGESTSVMTGTVMALNGAVGKEAVVVGTGVEEDTWNNLTLVHFKSPVTLTEEFLVACKA